MSALLPCPFCSSSDIAQIIGCPEPFIKCRDCGATAESMNRWNARAPVAPVGVTISRGLAESLMDDVGELLSASLEMAAYPRYKVRCDIYKEEIQELKNAINGVPVERLCVNCGNEDNIDSSPECEGCHDLCNWKPQ